MLGNLKSVFEKSPKEEENLSPLVPDALPINDVPVDLMAADPVANIDLMAADPLNSEPLPEATPQRVNEYVEAPGLEGQITQQAPTNNNTYITAEQNEEKTDSQTEPELDAFSMSVPQPEAMPDAKPEVEKLDIETTEEVLSKTQKMCSCGTPNDPLAKFCVSCGKTYE